MRCTSIPNLFLPNFFLASLDWAAADHLICVLASYLTFVISFTWAPICSPLVSPIRVFILVSPFVHAYTTDTDDDDDIDDDGDDDDNDDDDDDDDGNVK